MRTAVRRFFQAGMLATTMGVDDLERIVKMRPSLTTRISFSPTVEDDNHP
jgi:hypothetical protein